MVQYTAGSNKGSTTQGTVFNDPFKLGDVDVNYTSSRVVEAAAAGTGAQALAWTPVMKGSFENAGVHYDVKLVKAGASDIYGFYNPTDKKFYESYDASTDSYSTQITVAADTKVAYVYDNVVIPQNDLPIINARLESISLLAHARRVAVYYSQIAAYQAKTDYGFDLGDQLAEKAVGQLSYKLFVA